MNMPRFFIYLLFLFPPALCSQETGRSFKLEPAIKDIYFFPAFSFQQANSGTIQDFNTLMPGSEILRDNFNSASSQDGPRKIVTTAFAISAGLDLINTGEETNIHRQLRLGLSFNNLVALNCNYYQERRERYDTVHQGMQVIYLDSVKKETVSMNHVSQEVRLEASLLFRTLSSGRWSLYGGIGIDAGFSLRSFSVIQSSEELSLEGPDQEIMGNPAQQKTSERQANRTNYGLGTYIPLGLDVGLGNKRALRLIHLFLEIRPGINAAVIPETGTLILPYLKAGGGLRMSI
jgi:hypothetical protein